MGKKDKRPRKEAFDNEEEDNQIVEGMAVDDEEVAAVLAMRREKAQATLSGDSSEVKSIGKVEINGADGIGSEGIKTNVNYNKAALVQAVTSLNTSTLPFKETYRICEFGFEFTDENDDLAREVIALIDGYFGCMSHLERSLRLTLFHSNKIFERTMYKLMHLIVMILH